MNKQKVEFLKKSIENTIKKMTNMSEIEAVFLFGSAANHNIENINRNSDLDLMILVKNNFDDICEDDFESLLKKELELDKTLIDVELDLTIYNMKKFNELLTSGALFMLHLSNDAIMLYSSNHLTKEPYFKELNKFNGLFEDIFLYRRMLNSLSRSIEKNGVNFFDLSILGMITRNTLIIANYYKYKNETKFDKFEVFKILDPQKTSITMREYEEILHYKSYYNRNVPIIDLPDLKHTKILINNVLNLILQVQEDLGAVDAIDRLYYILDDSNTRNLYSTFEFFCDFDRALYMNLRKYLKNEYEIDLHSLKSKYLKSLKSKYSDDKLISLTINLSEYEKQLKKYSSNYTIYNSNETEIYKISENGMEFTDDFKTVLKEYRFIWKKYISTIEHM